MQTNQINPSSQKTEARESTSKEKRSRVSQTDVPSFSLGDALRIPRAIAENYAMKPVRPLALAQALEMSPTSGAFRMLGGAAIAYGLTDGGCFAEFVTITELGKRIVAPLEEGDDLVARREAVLRPSVVKRFLEKYDGFKIPKETIALNVLVEEMQVPKASAAKIFQLILESAKAVGFFRSIKGEFFIDLKPETDSTPPSSALNPCLEPLTNNIPDESRTAPASTSVVSSLPNKVFITHGKNKTFLPQLKDLLKYGGFEAIIAAERDTVSKPVPKKVMDDMRSCAAAIIHIDSEMEVTNESGEKQKIINGNVLIEIGAALALYGDRFVLLVQDGLTLPSNLQGLYQVRYNGTALDMETTLKLLKAFNGFKELKAESV